MNSKSFIGVLSAAFLLGGCATTLEPTMPTPAPSSTTASRSASVEPVAGAEATTADERRDELGRRLDESLEEFDKTLTAEQRKTAEEREARTADNRSAATGSSAAGSAAAGGLESATRPGDLRSERSSQAGSVAAGSSSATDRGVVSAGSGAPDRSIPSGDDDDIVARRLRRAAEQETDPELKEKLWNEYIDYKRNAQGRG